jgi:hypothetical protein
MSHIHHIGRLARILAGLAAALVAAIAAAPAALAQPYPPPGPMSRFGPVDPARDHTVVPAHTAVGGGMAGWQIALIALGAAILAAVVAVLIERTRSARRHPTPA